MVVRQQHDLGIRKGEAGIAEDGSTDDAEAGGAFFRPACAGAGNTLRRATRTAAKLLPLILFFLFLLAGIFIVVLVEVFLLVEIVVFIRVFFNR